jgi:nitrile hydratase beta subunit
MNGIHDMGGTDGFGPVRREPGEPVFHAPWEGRVFAFTRSLMFGGAWTLDETRHTQELLPPTTYLSVSYYKRWEIAFERLLMREGLVTQDELDAGAVKTAGKTLKRVLTADKVSATFTRPSFFRPAPGAAKFAIGDRVRTKKMHPKGATRLPRYARGCTGRIDRINGSHAFPDSICLGTGDDPQWLYTVVFDGQELWGPDTDPTVSVSIDAYEPYLEAA